MWIEQLLLALIGLSAGLSVASGVFTVFTAVGLVPRFAERTNSGNRILLYENMIILGCFVGCLFSLYSKQLLEAEYTLHAFGASEPLKNLILAFVGIFIGIYVGTLAISISEMLDAIPIMTHRVNLKKGISLVIAGLAVGKLVGSIFYYMNGVFQW